MRFTTLFIVLVFQTTVNWAGREDTAYTGFLYNMHYTELWGLAR